MLLNRIILLLFIIAAGVFASFHGGNTAYAFYYMTILIPVVSFLYTFYVYIRFRIYQEIEQRIIVKGELVPYAFTIANEDYITFRSVKVNFLDDKSVVLNTETMKEYCLLPNTSEKMETKIRCNYRGEYFIGANSIELMDFFYLFRVTYPIKSKLKITVLPRVLSIARLSIAPAQKDIKTSQYLYSQVKDTMDIDTHKYTFGDSKKLIHWKLSAKRNELFCRQYSSIPKAETIIVMDLQEIHEDDMTTTIVEDQIIESTLAIANYFMHNNTRVKIYYEQEGLQNILIKGKNDFNMFYQLCVGIHFQAKSTVAQQVEQVYNHSDNGNFYSIITHNLTQELYHTILQLLQNDNDIAVLFMKDNINSEDEDIIHQLRSYAVTIVQVSREDDIGEVLNS